MEAIVLITLVLVLIAQSLGLLAYYSKRQQYSNTAQNIGTLLPGAAFLVLAVLGALLWLLLAWWAEVGDLRGRLFGHGALVMWFGVYLVGGALGNIFLSILVQLVLLMVYPPTYKSRRRRRRRNASTEVSR